MKLQEFEVFVPYEYEKKVYTGEILEKKSLIFFSFPIKVFQSTGNWGMVCDKIDIVENFHTVNGKKLPIALKTVKYIEYEEQEITRTKSEMLSLAYTELYRYIDINYADAEILSRSVSITENESETILVCNLKCIKNIAQIKEIIVS